MREYALDEVLLPGEGEEEVIVEGMVVEEEVRMRKRIFNPGGSLLVGDEMFQRETKKRKINVVY